MLVSLSFQAQSLDRQDGRALYVGIRQGNAQNSRRRLAAIHGRHRVVLGVLRHLIHVPPPAAHAGRLPRSAYLFPMVKIERHSGQAAKLKAKLILDECGRKC